MAGDPAGVHGDFASVMDDSASVGRRALIAGALSTALSLPVAGCARGRRSRGGDAPVDASTADDATSTPATTVGPTATPTSTPGQTLDLTYEVAEDSEGDYEQTAADYAPEAGIVDVDGRAIATTDGVVGLSAQFQVYGPDGEYLLAAVDENPFLDPIGRGESVDVGFTVDAPPVPDRYVVTVSQQTESED